MAFCQRLGWSLVAYRRAALATAAVAALLIAAVPNSPARAQARDDSAVGAINLGTRGIAGGEARVRTTPSEDSKESAFEFSARGGFATDYIYRGTTLSDRKPAVGAAAEAAFRQFYAGVGVSSVKLPSQPAAEIVLNAGVRPKIGNIDFDFGWTYFHYPGETPPEGVMAGIDYWQVAARADTKIGEALRLAAGFAYSPNSQIPAPGATTRRPAWASTCRVMRCRRTSLRR